MKGITSTLKSVSKSDYTLVCGGSVVNQKIHPSVFKNKDSYEKLEALIRTYFKMGGEQIQFNVISGDTLKDAIEHPEIYDSLVVRVSGFSAFFNTLAYDVKKDILNRTEQRI
jgi:formate C-acetyltransferase